MAFLAKLEIAQRHFFDKAFYIADFDSPYDWQRKTFTEFGPLEAESADKMHKESGSAISWTGAGTISFSPITMKRGLGMDVPGGVIDKDMHDWWDATVNGIDATGAGGGIAFKRSCGVVLMTRSQTGYGFHWRVEDMVPKKYKVFEGDANSDDVMIEELECNVSRWYRDDSGPAVGIQVPG